MKHFLTNLLLLLTLVLAAAAEEVEIPGIPANPEEFTQLRDRLAVSPEGGAATTIAALLAFSKSRELGLQCLTLVLDPSNRISGSVIGGYAPGGSIMYHVDRISGYNMWPYLGFAYLKGAKASNDYQVSAPYTVVTVRQKNSGTNDSGSVKLLVECDGFRPRPIRLKRNDKGLWKALEFSSLMLNVQPPASAAPKDDL